MSESIDEVRALRIIHLLKALLPNTAALGTKFFNT
jgi:hypothetical protein